MRTRTAVILLVAAALAAGCSKKKKDEAKGSSDDQAKQAAQAAPASDELRSMLALVPVASEAVIGVDFAAVRASELYKAYEKDLGSMFGTELAAIRDLCGFDPQAKVSSLVAGGAGGRRRGDATVVLNGLGKAETMACLQKGVAAPPKGTAVVVDGDYAKIERLPEAVKDKAGKPIVPPTSAVDAGAGAPAVMPDVPKDSVSLQFLDDDTVVLARRGGEAVEKDAMAAVLKLDAASSVVGSQGFMEMIDGIDTSAPIWFVINGKTPGGAKMTGGFLKFDAAFGQVYVGDGLDIDVTMRLESADAATRMADVVQHQVDSMRRSILKDALGEVKVEHRDRDMRLRIKESRQQLEKLIEEVGDLLLTMLGG